MNNFKDLIELAFQADLNGNYRNADIFTNRIAIALDIKAQIRKLINKHANKIEQTLSRQLSPDDQTNINSLLEKYIDDVLKTGMSELNHMSYLTEDQRNLRRAIPREMWEELDDLYAIERRPRVERDEGDLRLPSEVDGVTMPSTRETQQQTDDTPLRGRNIKDYVPQQNTSKFNELVRQVNLRSLPSEQKAISLVRQMKTNRIDVGNLKIAIEYKDLMSDLRSSFRNAVSKYAKENRMKLKDIVLDESGVTQVKEIMKNDRRLNADQIEMIDDLKVVNQGRTLSIDFDKFIENFQTDATKRINLDKDTLRKVLKTTGIFVGIATGLTLGTAAYNTFGTRPTTPPPVKRSKPEDMRAVWEAMSPDDTFNDINTFWRDSEYDVKAIKDYISKVYPRAAESPNKTFGQLKLKK